MFNGCNVGGKGVLLISDLLDKNGQARLQNGGAGVWCNVSSSNAPMALSGPDATDNRNYANRVALVRA